MITHLQEESLHKVLRQHFRRHVFFIFFSEKTCHSSVSVELMYSNDLANLMSQVKYRHKEQIKSVFLDNFTAHLRRNLFTLSTYERLQCKIKINFLFPAVIGLASKQTPAEIKHDMQTNHKWTNKLTIHGYTNNVIKRTWEGVKKFQSSSGVDLYLLIHCFICRHT